MNITELIKNNFEKLNSMTKYPSILTYHSLGEKGRLKEELTAYDENKRVLDFNTDGNIYISEKVNGRNGRIILLGNDYIIGTREELVYSKGDRIVNPIQEIAETAIPLAEKMVEKYADENVLQVVYFEVFGGKHDKQYTKNNKLSLRIFDAWVLHKVDVKNILSMDINRIASWRDSFNQPYLEILQLDYFIEGLGDSRFKRTPDLDVIKETKLPKTLLGTYRFLLKYYNTKVVLDEGLFGRSEGVVIRNSTRTFIKKIRFEEYERTLGREFCKELQNIHNDTSADKINIIN